MKLRIKGNTIRLRLLRSEVERFAAEGSVTEETTLANSTFRYSLRASDDIDQITASFADGEISIAIPRQQALDWANGDGVGLESPGTLSVLVEKDFVCVDRPNDPDREDAYPNPVLTCATQQ